MGAGHRGVAATIVVSLLTSAGCRGEPKVLEPRTPPPRRAPAVPLPPTPPPQGYGRVVLASTDAALGITARADTTFVPPGHPVPPNRTGDLCTTPCAADLPIGRYKLYMTSADGSYSQGDTDVLDVRDGTTYYLRAPGKFESPTWIPVLPTVLVTLATLSVLGGIGLAASDDDSQRTTGAILIGGGIAVGVAGGILYYDASRGAIQEGATTTWTDPPSERR